MYKVVVIACIAVIASLLAMTFWTQGPKSQVDLTFNNELEANHLDPHRMSWQHEIRIANALFEGLLAFKVNPPQPGQAQGDIVVVPGMAQRYEVSPDGRTYTFHIRPDARWSNGQPVTAPQFRWSWQRVMTPVTAADYASMMFVIQGAKAYFDALQAGQPASFESVGVKAPDDRTLVVTLAQPSGFFLELLAFVPFMPVYPPLLQSVPKAGSPVQGGITVYDEDAWTQPGKIVGNGPFVLASRLFKREMVLEKNPLYWDAANVTLNHVRVLAIEDVNAALQAYESKRCDMITAVPTGLGRVLQATDPANRRPDFCVFPTFGTYFYRFNCQPTFRDGKKNPFADLRVRRAFALTADKRGIVDQVTGLHQRIADTLIPSGLTVTDRAGQRFTYACPPGNAYAPAVARKLLDEAGYADRAKLGEVNLMISNSGTHEAIAERMAFTWQRELGVKVVINKKDGNAFGQALKQKQGKEWNIARSSWFGDYRDPTTFLGLFITDDGNNDCGYSNKDFDALLAQAAGTDDQARRMELFRQAETIAIVDEAAIVPLYYYANMHMIRPWVQGVWPNMMDMILLKQIRVEGR